MPDGAIGMRPSAILRRRPSIFKSPSLAKRAGGRRVFLSRRKITHCPLSAVPRPSPTSRLAPPLLLPSSLLLFASPVPLAEISLFLPFQAPPGARLHLSTSIFFRSPRDQWRTGEDMDSREAAFEKREIRAMQNIISLICPPAKLYRSD